MFNPKLSACQLESLRVVDGMLSLIGKEISRYHSSVVQGSFLDTRVSSEGATVGVAKVRLKGKTWKERNLVDFEAVIFLKEVTHLYWEPQSGDILIDGCCHRFNEIRTITEGRQMVAKITPLPEVAFLQ